MITVLTDEYKIAYSEVLEILKYVDKKDINKVPVDMLNMFKKNASNENKFNYDPNKTLQEQNVSEVTRIIIAILFRDYWATLEQKEKIISVQNTKRKKTNEEKYSNNDIFKNKVQEENNVVKDSAIVEYKEKNIFFKLIYKIKCVFKRK